MSHIFVFLLPILSTLGGYFLGYSRGFKKGFSTALDISADMMDILVEEFNKIIEEKEFGEKV